MMKPRGGRVVTLGSSLGFGALQFPLDGVNCMSREPLENQVIRTGRKEGKRTFKMDVISNGMDRLIQCLSWDVEGKRFCLNFR